MPAASLMQAEPPERKPETSWREEVRATIALALPLIFTQLAQMAISTTDIVLLGRFSRGALAAAAIGNTVYYFAWFIGGGPGTAVAPMVAHLIGARRVHTSPVRAALRMGLWSVLLLSLPMIAVLWQTRPILLALGQDPQVAADAGRFVAILALGLPFSLALLVLRNFAAAVGRPKAGLWVVLSMIGFNALAGYVLIFGHFGAPRLGIVGSGLATAGSAVFGLVAMLVTFRFTPDLRAFRIFRRSGRLVRAKLAEVFRLGMPIGLTKIFEATLFSAMTLVMGTFGTAAVAAHQIAMNVVSVTFMVPLGLGMAAIVRVGLAAGAGDTPAARRAGLSAMILSVVFISVCAVAMFVGGPQIAVAYLGGAARGDGEVIAMAALFLKVGAAFQIFDALQVVGALSLRGLKDARMPMILAAGAYWLVGAPICLVWGITLHMRGLGVWIGLAIGLAAAAVAMTVRFHLLTRSACAASGH